MNLFRLAVRNLLRSRGRTQMTVGVIAFGVCALMTSGGFVDDILDQLAEAVIRSQSGHLQISKEGFQRQGTRKPDQYLIDDAGGVIQEVRHRIERFDAMSRISFSALMSNGRKDYAVLVEGIEAAPEENLGTFLRVLNGRRLNERDVDAAMIGDGLASALGLGPGDHATLIAATTGGATNSVDVEIVGIFQTFSREFDARVARVPLPLAQELFGTQGVNRVVVLLDETKRTEASAEALRGAMGAIGLEVSTWRELNDFFGKTEQLYEQQFGALRLIIFFMVLLSVANSMNMTLFERQAEFGTMRALGNRGRHVMQGVLTEGLLLGLGGAGIGVAFGVLLAQGISAVGIPMPPPPNSNSGYIARIAVDAWSAVSAFAVGVSAALLGALFPAIRVSRTSIVDSLRQSA
jgi:putative ABC transport system permease protein